MSVQGFILQPTYRIESGRVVVYLWGRLENGESFVVCDDRTRPRFYIRRQDRHRAEAIGITGWMDDPHRTLTGDDVVRLEMAVPAETPPLRDKLQRAGIETFEADVRFAMRYLIDRDIRGSVAIEGPWERGGTGVDRVYRNPSLAPADWSPELSILSLDIETDPNARHLLSIGLYGRDVAEVLLVCDSSESLPARAVALANEIELLQRLQKRVGEIDPDIITGWNVVDFDFSVLLRRAQELRTILQIGRDGSGARLRSGRSRRESAQVLVSGRLVLDGLQLLRGAFVRMERHTLDFVAREVLGEGKVLTHSDRGTEILRNYREDLPRFVDYNLTDARLVFDILEELHLVELAIERSRLTGLPLDRVSSSVAAFDFLYLKELGKRLVVAPSVVRAGSVGAPTGGGHVLEPEPGLYDLVLLLDFKSLYPSLIRTFQIDPLGYVAHPQADEDLIVAPNGATFRRQAGILTQLLDELVPKRDEAKRLGRTVESHAIKILMNSFYGVLGTPVCRFYNPAVANAITSAGRQLLIWSKERLELWDYRVLYGDTDSLFIESGATDRHAAELLGRRLAAKLNRALEEHIEEVWKVESRLELEFEKVYLRLFLPPVRRGTAGARKRYAGLVEHEREPIVEFTGMEAVRRDWTDLARSTQRELYRRLFLDLPVEAYLRELVASIRRGEHDEALVYRKGLRKDLDSYTATSPPHVVAARKLSQPPGSLISYLMTTEGPEPQSEQLHPIDYQHYLERQLQPIAEPVLDQLGLQFAKVIGDDTQLDLF